MKEKLKKRNGYSLFKGLIIGLVFTFAFVAVGIYAYDAVTSVTINNSNGVVNIAGGEVSSDEVVGDDNSDIFGSASDYCSGDNELAQMCNIGAYSLTLEAVGSSGSFDYSSVTTTPSVKTYFDINPDVTFRATSTIRGETDAAIEIASYINTGNDLICNLIYLDQATANVSVTADYRAGTTTCIVAGTNCGDDGLVSWTNTSTDTLLASTTAITTFTTEINRFVDEPGSYFDVGGTGSGVATSSNFLLKHSEAIVWSWNNNATSSDSTSASGGFTGVANVGANCRLR